MQLATLLVCFLALLSNEQFTDAFARREEARLIALFGLPEIEKNVVAQPNSFLLYYSARKYEELGDTARAKEDYQNSLELMNIPSAILLLDEAGEGTDFGMKICKKIENLKLDSGALRIPLLAHYFLHRGFLRSRIGLNPERSFRLSIEMDPFQISSRLALINHYLRHLNPLLYNELIGLFRSLRDFSNQYALLINIYSLTSVVVVITLFLCLIGLLIKHARSIYHSLLSLLPIGIPYHLRLGIVALIILVPVLMGLGSLWLWVGVVLVTALFCNFREKVLLIGGAVLLLVTPLLTTFEQRALEVGDALLLHRAQVSPYDSTLLDSLYAIKEERPSYGLLFSIGLLEKRRGDFDAAEQIYVEVQEENPESSAVHNNLGNVLFNAGEIEDALTAYEKAIELNPDLASAHYNLSQVYLKLMRFDKYTEEIEIANKLDFDIVTEFINDSSEHPNRVMIDERLPGSVLWREIFLSQGKQLVSPILQLGNLLLLSAGCILLVSLILMGRAVRLTRKYCSVCRAPVCNKCARIIEQEIVCSSCASKLKLTKSPGIQQKMAQGIKVRKARLKKLTATFLSVLPGMGHIYIGSICRGFFLLLVSVYVVVGIIYNGVPYRPETLIFDFSVLRSILAISFLILIGLAVFDILKRKMVV